MSRLASLAAAVLMAATPVSAQQVILHFQCDLGGVPAQMIMGVEYQSAFDPLFNNQGNISGLFPAGVTVYTAGQISNNVSHYSFRGENDFADFTDLVTGQRFRVQWVLDGVRNGVWMRVNPFGGTTTYFCAFKGAQ